MIEDCAQTSVPTGRAGTPAPTGDLGIFSFQQSKHLTTGDGGMMVTDREDLHHKLYNEWAFSGESPAFLTLNFRMNEVTAAVGLAQLQRVTRYLEDEYTPNLRTMNAAIADCEWLRPRHVPAEAKQSGYIWACTWEGDRDGLDYDRFQASLPGAGAAHPVRFQPRSRHTSSTSSRSRPPTTSPTARSAAPSTRPRATTGTGTASAPSRRT